jgi:phosphatidylethanolamine/phosphatidyl-N-methylethanolamine N-methyltransferase
VSLRTAYSLYAPFYDYAVAPLFRDARRLSLSGLPRENGTAVLLNGIGTGLDLPLLPPGRRYVGLDLARAMLDRAVKRAAYDEFTAVQGNSLALPFANASFDHVVLHMILTVAPDSARVLAETARVVRPGGMILVLDKFLRPGQRAPLRRLLSPLAAHLATQLDVVFEELLRKVPGLRVLEDEPAAFGGWFRRIRLQKL